MAILELKQINKSKNDGEDAENFPSSICAARTEKTFCPHPSGSIICNPLTVDDTDKTENDKTNKC